MRADFFPKSGAISGPEVDVDVAYGDTSGRGVVAGVIARIFPAHRAFVQKVMAMFDQPTGTYTFGPYPHDKLIVQTDRAVQFETPPHSDGLGTMSRLKGDGDPIDGVAILKGKAPDLVLLSVRLAKEQRDLAPIIIHDLPVREGGDAR